MSGTFIVSSYVDSRELKQRGQERERERYETIDLATEYNHFTWECNHAPGHFSAVIFRNRA